MLIKDPENINLVDNSSSFNSEFLNVQIHRCNNATSTVTCASYAEIDTYIQDRRFGFGTLLNFIDYDEVDPFKGPLKTAL